MTSPNRAQRVLGENTIENRNIGAHAALSTHVRTKMTHACYMRTDEIPKCDSLSNAEFVLRNWPRRTSTKPFDLKAQAMRRNTRSAEEVPIPKAAPR